MTTNKNPRRLNESDIVHSSNSNFLSNRKHDYRNTSDNDSYSTSLFPYDKNQISRNKVYQTSDTIKKLEEVKKRLEDEIHELKSNLGQCTLSYEKRSKELQNKYD